MAKHILILSVFVVASCGLAYELIAGALSSYLLGDSILQFSTVIGTYLFAMGVGSHLSKYINDQQLINRFIDIEIAIGLVGGLSATLLFVSFGWAPGPFRVLLYTLVFSIGVLVGMEIPLVMRLLNARHINFSDLVSKVLTFDYLGALAVSLIFPLVLSPWLGIARTAFVFGMLNIAVGIWTIHVFKSEIQHAVRQFFRACSVLFILAIGFIFSDTLVAWGEHGLLGDQVVFSTTTPYQRLVLTRWKDDLRLYINGNLQFSSRDEYRYHEALVHPALATLPWAKSVLILGGGDGLALREVLRYKHIERVTLVDIDPAMTHAFKQRAELVRLNNASLTDPRVTVVNTDAAVWLQESNELFDAAIVDFPDPSSYALGKLYSVSFYELLKQHISVNGLIVVQSTSPYFAPHAYWSINATLKEVGLKTYPYHAYVPSFGEWGFILASPQAKYTPPKQYPFALRFLDQSTTEQMFLFPPDMPTISVEPNRLNSQSLVHYFEQDWHRVVR